MKPTFLRQAIVAWLFFLPLNFLVSLLLWRTFVPNHLGCYTLTSFFIGYFGWLLAFRIAGRWLTYHYRVRLPAARART